MLTMMLMMLVAMVTALLMLMLVVMPWSNVIINNTKLTLLAAVAIIMTIIVLWRAWPDKIIVATPATTAFGLGPCVARFNAAEGGRFDLEHPLFRVPAQH